MTIWRIFCSMIPLEVRLHPIALTYSAIDTNRRVNFSQFFKLYYLARYFLFFNKVTKQA